MISDNSSPAIESSESHHENQEYDQLSFKYLPAYAKYLLENKLEEFTKAQLSFSKEIKLPLLKHLDNVSEDELIKIGIINNHALLTCFIENKVEAYINNTIEKWQNNQLPFIFKNQLIAEDIALFNFIRRYIFRQFISGYTTNNDVYQNILTEVDVFTTRSETAGIKAFFDMQQQLFSQAQSLSHIGNWHWNLKTKQLFWSNEIYRMYELEPQSTLVSQNIGAYNHPSDTAAIDWQMQSALQSLKPHDFFYRIILKDGRQKTLHTKGEVKLDNNGTPIEMFGTLQDVTEQKQKEKELDENKKFIEKITHTSPCIITVYNIKSGNYLYLNKGVQTILGYNLEEFYKNGRARFYSLIHEDDIQIIKQKNENIIAEANLQKETISEKINDLKYRLKHKDGSYRWMQTFTTVFNRDSNNSVLEMLNVSIDVTESQLLTLQLEKINEEIKYKELQHQRMTNEVEDYAILLMDKDGIIQTWNKGAEKIKGYAANEIIGKNFRLFYRQEDRDKKLPESLLEEAALKGRAQHEGWRLRKDGLTFWGNIVITALHDENNNVIGFSKVTRNLTERKLAEDKLKEYASEIEKHNKELQHINKELDSFTYMASHDLQEPLRKIRTFSNIILSKAEETFSTDVANYFQRIITSVTRMQTLIDSLLDYSRAGKTAIIPEVINLGSVINEVKKNLAETIEEKKALIEYSNLPVLKVQPLQFHQLFFNLIENAIKYSRENVPPVIKIEATTFFKENENGAKIQFSRISVTDNSIGFEQQYADSIFKLFQRLHGRSEYAGTGIGLAICKKIVENHNGTIKVISQPGKGSTFIIELPADNIKTGMLNG